MLRIVLSGSIGLILGYVIVAVVGPPGAAVWALPVGMTLGILSLTVLIIAAVARHAGGPSAEAIAVARAAGRTGIARIDALRQTGTQINDQPLCQLEVSVRPRHGRPYRTVMRRVLPLVDIPRFQPGQRIPVVVLAEGHPDIAFLDESPSAADLSADIPAPDRLGPVRPIVKGAVNDPGRPEPLMGRGKRGRPLRVLAYALAFILAAAAVVYPYRESVAVAAESVRQGSLFADLRDPEPLQRAIAAIDEAKGHDAYVSITIFEDYLVAEAPVTVGSVETDRWTYRRGAVKNEGPASIQPDGAGEQFSSAEVAWETFKPALAQGAALAEVADEDVVGEASFSVRRGFDFDAMDDLGDVEVSFWFDGPYTDYFFRMNADGSGLELQE